MLLLKVIFGKKDMSSKEKLLKLNLGCGFHAYPGWLNVDKQESCDPDMQVDLEPLSKHLGTR